MPDDPVTPAASTPATDAAPAASTPAPDAPGTQVPAGYVPQAELEKAQATARGLQSEKDKLAARVAEMSKPAPTDPQKPAAAADTAALLADFERRMELREAKAEFASDDRFKGADPSILARATEFDSREAFEAALVASAETHTALVQRIRAEESERILADVRSKYPDYAPGDAAPPTSQGGGTPTDGQMTVDKLASLSQAAYEQWVADNPKEYERLTAGVL